jgi:hypothetical protein
MGFENEIIDGNEFLLKTTQPPKRAEPISHQCVCLLVRPTEVEGVMIRDKCSQEVSSPDQAFCDDCESNEHHLLPTQQGEARHIHRNNKEF